MNKIKRSGKLLKAAFAVLFREKKLLFFPVIASGLAMLAAMLFILPVVLYPTGHSYFSAAHWQALVDSFFGTPGSGHGGQPVAVSKTGAIMFLTNHPWAVPLFGVVYFVSMFLATFSNVAFYHEIMQALNGHPVSIRRGFRFAASRWQAVLLWSLFAGLVGYVINAIQERLGFLGQGVVGLIGVVWSTACIFVIPTLVRDVETANPLKLLRHSAGTFKRTWGELIVGFVGLELAFGMILMAVLLLLTAGVGIVGLCIGLNFWAGTLWLLLLATAGMLALSVPLSLVSGVVNPVYRCALYIYATEGVVPDTFDKELLDSAWKVK